ncbi:MAG TPA: hypothetical protein VEY30_06920, partial [Myxococcaceae bacterium]|nr:hypothetical protein [Myxococcaceae bacterium]
MNGRWLSFGACAALLAACRHAPPLPAEQRAALARDARAYVSGAVRDLARRAVLNRRDFVYGIALSPGADRAAFTHLDFETFRLGLWALTPEGEAPRAIADVELNGYERDVEAVAFSPDGLWLATAGRDGALRLFDAQTGALLRQAKSEEPLTAVAFDASGENVVAGGAAGTLSVFARETLASGAVVHAHEGEIRAVQVAPDGSIYSGGFDKTVAVFAPASNDGSAGTLEPRARFTFEGYVNDLTLDRQGSRMGLALSDVKAERTPKMLRREKKGREEPVRPANAGVIADARTGKVLRRWAHHRSVVATAALSPDGQALATGGWDNRVFLFDQWSSGDAPRAQQALAWDVRRLRFSANGRYLAAAA